MVKNPPANAGDARGADSSPGWGRCPEVGNGNLLQYFAWKWTEELGGPQFMGSQIVEHNERTHTHKNA